MYFYRNKAEGLIVIYNILIPIKQTILLIVVLFFTDFLNAESPVSQLKLEYGYLFQQPNGKTITVLDSGAVVGDNDELRVNVRYTPKAFCYIIYEDPVQNVWMLFNSNGQKSKGLEENFHSTGWLSFSPPAGLETIYRIDITDDEYFLIEHRSNLIRDNTMLEDLGDDQYSIDTIIDKLDCDPDNDNCDLYFFEFFYL